MWIYIFFAAFLCSAGVWIFKPLLLQKDQTNPRESDQGNTLERLIEEKEGAYAAIHELQFDLHMGKLSEADFQILKRQYMQQAAGCLQAMDKLQLRLAEKQMLADKHIEEEIE